MLLRKREEKKDYKRMIKVGMGGGKVAREAGTQATWALGPPAVPSRPPSTIHHGSVPLESPDLHGRYVVEWETRYMHCFDNRYLP